MVDNVVPPANQTPTNGAVTTNTAPVPGNSSDSSSSGSSSGGPGNLALASGPLDSDASLITGEYFQNYQAPMYLSDGSLSGIDLQYSSLQAYPLLVFSVFLTTQANSDSPNLTSITESMLVNGSSQGSDITYDDISLANGQTYLVQVPAANATSDATSVYPVSLTITKYYSNASPSTAGHNGNLMVVNDSSSPYGAGWSVGGLQRMTVVSPGGVVMIVVGSGQPEEFTTGNGNTYTGDGVDTSSLLYSMSSGTYTRTYVDGTVVTFSGSGQETSVADRNGNTYSFSYVGGGPATGALYTVTDPAGKITTLGYDTYGHLSTITDPAGRVTTVTVGSSSDNLTQIEDPSTAVTQYGYNSNHQITTETNPDSQTATVTYDGFGRMSSESLFGATGTVTVASAQKVGLTSPGGTTPLVYPSEYGGSTTDADGATTSMTFDDLGGAIAETDGRGQTTTITRNSHDWPATVTDPLGAQPPTCTIHQATSPRSRRPTAPTSTSNTPAASASRPRSRISTATRRTSCSTATATSPSAATPTATASTTPTTRPAESSPTPTPTGTQQHIVMIF